MKNFVVVLVLYEQRETRVYEVWISSNNKQGSVNALEAFKKALEVDKGDYPENPWTPENDNSYHVIEGVGATVFG